MLKMDLIIVPLIISLIAATQIAFGQEVVGNQTQVPDVPPLFRLPNTVLPLYYKVDLIPFLDPESNFSIQGKVWIDVQCIQETKNIILHARNLTIFPDKIRIVEVHKSEASIASTRDIKETILVEECKMISYEADLLQITFSQKLVSGQVYRISMQYTGLLEDSMYGIFRSSYLDSEKKNTINYLGVSQFRPIEARKAFPCFDEPALKAKFEISVGRDATRTSVSNMNFLNSTPIPNMNGWEWDHFAKSPPMSTYLVGIFVSDFTASNVSTENSTDTVRVWTRNSVHVDGTLFAIDFTAKILAFFEEYFNMSFPLPKLDMVAIPDLITDGLGDWGMIMFKEGNILYDSGGSTDYNKRQIALTISHQLAHQWIGSLVTFKWWNELWLYEGIAAILEVIGVHAIDPDWKAKDYFLCRKTHTALQLDALDSSHPLELSITDNSRFPSVFDTITYYKGAALVRMVFHMITESSFRKGLTNYLRVWSYKTVDASEFWSELTNTAQNDGNFDYSLSLDSVLRTWTSQKGYPVVTAHRKYDSGSVTLTQTKFTYKKTLSPSRWFIPISYATQTENSAFNNTRIHIWLNTEETPVTPVSLVVPEETWLILNVLQLGFYRVNYDEKNWRLILGQLKHSHTVINGVNRAQLVDDALNLARAGLLTYNTALDFISYLQFDKEYLPWHTFLSSHSYLESMLSRTAFLGRYHRFIRSLVDNPFKAVGFEENSFEILVVKLHRVDIVELACSAELLDCITKTKSMFYDWMNSNDPANHEAIPINLRKTIYSTAIRFGGEAEWDFLWGRYTNSTSSSHQQIILEALAAANEDWLLYRYLTWALSVGKGIRKQDGCTIFKAMSQYPLGRAVMLRFMEVKWPEMIKHYGLHSPALSEIIIGSTSGLNTPVELLQVQLFAQKHVALLGTVQPAINQAVEKIKLNIDWMEEYLETINDWLETYLTSEHA